MTGSHFIHSEEENTFSTSNEEEYFEKPKIKSKQQNKQLKAKGSVQSSILTTVSTMHSKENIPLNVSSNDDNSSNTKSVEEIYQKKTQLEHILLRPDTYIGSVEQVTQEMYVLEKSTKKIIQRKINFVPGLFKIFDEILVNAADNKASFWFAN